MFLSSVSGRHQRLLAVLAGTCAALVVSTLIDQAEARPRRGAKKVYRAAPAYAPPFAALVVDANSGKVLYSQNADALRHPASITKVMTLYMLFEQLEKRRLSLNSEIPISSHAASMPPTKLGLRPGSTISVEDAIKAFVTKSANDMAAAVGEAIGGSEDRFAQLMNQKAKSLGMTRTNFENASGLPNPDQVTTATDLAILGRAMRERFPQYFHYFGTPAVQVGSRILRNHNRLLGNIEGVDGIKTGYTRASGFNLLTSARRGNKRIVAVVLGGSSAGRRDAMMANLVETHIERAAGTRSAPRIAEREAPAPAPVAVAQAPAPRPPAKPEAPARAEVQQPAASPSVFGFFQNRREEPRPEPVATGRPLALAAYARTEPARPAVISAAPRTGDLIPTATIPNAPVIIDGSTRSRTIEASAGATATGARATTPSNLRWLAGPTGADRKPAPAPKPEFAAAPALPPAAIPAAAPAVEPPATRVARAAPQVPARAVEPEESTIVRVARSRPAAAAQGVMIQIGATDNQEKARELLDRAKSRSGGALAGAKPFTETIQKGGETLYRARFAGLDEKSAEAACRTLKRSGLGCFTTRN